jgi:hypothetical protein
VKINSKENDIFDSLFKGVVGVVADVVSPVTNLIGIDKKTLVGLAVAGYTVYEISQLTGIATDVIEKVLED